MKESAARTPNRGWKGATIMTMRQLMTVVIGFQTSLAVGCGKGSSDGSDITVVTSALAIPAPPTCNGHLTPHGGGVIAHARINVVYWGSAVNSHYQLSYLQALAGNKAFYNRLHEYGVSTGSFGRSFDFSSGVAGPFILDTTIVAGIKQAIGTFVPTSSDIFLVMIPSGSMSGYDFGSDFGGHHASFNLNGVQVPYGTVEFSNGDSTSQQVIASHEITEALVNSDPTMTCNASNCSYNFMGHGWWQIDATKPDDNEVGDLCQNRLPRKIGGLTVAQMWSQLSCGCHGGEDLNNADVLGNGRFARIVFRPSTQQWWAQGFGTQYVFGSGIPTTGDFDGDGVTEFTLFTPGSPGQMNVLSIAIPGSPPGLHTVGSDGNDTPVPGDYDGDGKTDVAVWNTQSGNWSMQLSGSGLSTIQWGAPGDVPVPQDYDGDGLTDRAVFRASTKSWLILPANGGQSLSATWSAFQAGDIVVPGDFNGDALADFAFWRPSTGVWFVSYQFGGAYTWQWGAMGDIPIGRDVDGDFITDLVIYRPSEQNWYTWYSSNWTGSGGVRWGQANDIPLKQ